MLTGSAADEGQVLRRGEQPRSEEAPVRARGVHASVPDDQGAARQGRRGKGRRHARRALRPDRHVSKVSRGEDNQTRE